MTIEEINKMSFNEAIDILLAEIDDITTYDHLKDFAIMQINRDNIHYALHILNAIEDGAEYYKYDYCMGTYDTPTELCEIEDLYEFCEEKMI